MTGSPAPAVLPDGVAHGVLTCVFAVCGGGDPVRLAASPGHGGGGQVGLLELGGSVWAVTQDVPAALFSEDALRRRLADSAELERCVRAHHAVVTAAAAAGPVVPLPLGTLFTDARRARDALAERRPHFTAVLDRVRGCAEWAVKVHTTHRGGSPASEAGARTGAWAESEAEAGTRARTGSKAEPQGEAGAGTEAGTGTEAGARAGAWAGTEARAGAWARAAAGTEVGTGTGTEAGAGTGTEAGARTPAGAGAHAGSEPGDGPGAVARAAARAAAGPGGQHATGRGYLTRVRERERDRHARRDAALTAAGRVHEAVGRLAVDSVRRRPHGTGITGKDRVQVMNGAYLVTDARTAELAPVIAALRADCPPGLDIEVSGPWPPYSFTGEGRE